MPIRFLVTLLAASTLAHAEDFKSAASRMDFDERESAFVLVPGDICKKDEFRPLCARAHVPLALEGRWLELRNPKQAMAYLSPSNGPSDDHFELLCYRCAFNKVERGSCGRYKKVHNRPSEAVSCPKVK
jgi:hypothetical protein